ncbi:MAG TPA: serine/threonine-protein kinase [Dermatophilaceae bacterium]|nr:serine/threonine-protein kinase [Dermatophilaceae bacterium]
MSLFLEQGRVIGGRYILTHPIASGGMGDVWEATDAVLDRGVAVKILRTAGGPEDEGFTERFRDEAKHAASLTHPNVAAVYDYGEEDGTAYLVMERVPGVPLSDLIRAGAPLALEQVRWILSQAALALAAAHDIGLVHRDVKPGNIIVTPEGTAKLTDFGIARAGEGKGHTLTGEVLGTPDYISPEQALGEPATNASDIYSLGVVAHEMLSGAKPFDMGAPVATALAHVNDAPPPLPDSVPADLREVVDACLSKAPQDRPADARRVAAALGVPVDPVTPVVAVAAATTTRMPVVTPATPRWETRADARTQAPTDDSVRRRVWILAPIAALVIAAAFGIGKLVSSDPSQASSPPPASVSTSGSSVTMTPSTTAPPTSTTNTPAATKAPANQAPAPAKEKGKPADPGKGKGQK